MIKSSTAAVILAAAIALSACSTTGTAPAGASKMAQQGSISYSVGPCFGFCPVYSAVLSPGGTVSFEGKRHTTVLGVRTREAGPMAYAQVSALLAPFRPTSGTTAKTTCEVEASDGSTYQIIWSMGDGRRTVLDHGLGCRSASNDRLNEALRQIPEKLGIADWSQQISRPGAPRG
jgi:hypothetical protein